MNTQDLSSYYPGYEEYEEKKNAQVPFEDYCNLERKIEIYEKFYEEIEEVLNEPKKEKYDLQCIKAIVEDMKRNL